MTVKELIEILKTLPEDTIVLEDELEVPLTKNDVNYYKNSGVVIIG